MFICCEMWLKGALEYMEQIALTMLANREIEFKGAHLEVPIDYFKQALAERRIEAQLVLQSGVCPWHIEAVRKTVVTQG